MLILAESHLAIHTWPEDNLIAIDLFSCGAIDGHQVAAELARLLRLDDVHMQQIERGYGRTRRARPRARPQAGTDSDSPNWPPVSVHQCRIVNPAADSSAATPSGRNLADTSVRISSPRRTAR